MPRTDTYVGGLRDLSRKLKAIDPALEKELRGTLRSIAARVASKTRARVPVRTGRARASVRSGANASAAWVAEGKASVPYMGWLDFGGVLKPTGGRRNTISRPVLKEGRYLYPSVAADRVETVRDVRKAMDEAARKAGFNE